MGKHWRCWASDTEYAWGRQAHEQECYGTGWRCRWTQVRSWWLRMLTRVVRPMVMRADTGGAWWCRWRFRQTRVVMPMVMQACADTGCHAGGDAGRHGLSCRWWRRQTRVVVPVVTQADTGCCAGGDAGRHGLSCRWRCRQTRVVVPVAMQADTGCRAGGDAGRHGLSCRWRCRQTRVVVPVAMQADTGCRAGGNEGRHGLSCQWWLTWWADSGCSAKSLAGSQCRRRWPKECGGDGELTR